MPAELAWAYDALLLYSTEPNYSDIERQGSLDAYNMRVPHSTPPAYVLAKAVRFPMAITEDALRIKDHKERLKKLYSKFYNEFHWSHLSNIKKPHANKVRFLNWTELITNLAQGFKEACKESFNKEH